MELLRNARDARAKNIYVASVLRRRRYRTLTVIDDGHGIPDRYRDLIFEPGVTTRHLDPSYEPSGLTGVPHGAGLSLYHIRELALKAAVMSTNSPTSVTVTFDTRNIRERSLQSDTRPSRTNLLAAMRDFATNWVDNPLHVNLYYGKPATILATMLNNRIIHTTDSSTALMDKAKDLGLEMSFRTVHSVREGKVSIARALSSSIPPQVVGKRREHNSGGGPLLRLGEEEMSGIKDILGRAARGSYLELEDLGFESKPGEISVRARVYEPEDEYE